MSRSILALLGALSLSIPGIANAESVNPSLHLDTMRVEITWVNSDRELIEARAKLGNRAEVGPLIGREKGLSVLSKLHGEFVCRLYARRPRNVDDDHTLTLGHELTHCLLGRYHR